MFEMSNCKLSEVNRQFVIAEAGVVFHVDSASFRKVTRLASDIVMPSVKCNNRPSDKGSLR